MEYIADHTKKKTDGCVFCVLPKETDDRNNLILHRGERVFVILNKYPYNSGHLMVVPNAHISDMELLSEADLTDVMLMTRHCIKALKEAYGSEGYNIGMNLGEAGGAGIRHHLHMHIVPRWVGDTNFMPVIGETKSLPQHLLTSYDKLHDYFRRL